MSDNKLEDETTRKQAVFTAAIDLAEKNTNRTTKY